MQPPELNDLEIAFMIDPGLGAFMLWLAAHGYPTPLRRPLPDPCYRHPGGFMVHIKPRCRCT